ncbi:hypothetical protein K0I63_18980 [Shewanella rhizosphaerae]|uniref:hypothetical protein n=1 Tax=Shewanella rhizosphaerae TaxID=2864207 RepID=UPI001C6550C0|nr:hypothetical protein [Shewanella rhizosphaerae]QYK12779.1 hypothetical protein K0I63_18980 [Shewanella rhizosphaerae]
MEPAVIKMIEVIAVDAIKILGPAVIAALATYKATKAQYDAKLQELTKGHEFKAREHLFDYYKERQGKLSKSHEELSNILGQVLGFSAVTNDVTLGDCLHDLANTFFGIARLYHGQAPFEISTTLRDFESKGIQEEPEYEKLNFYLHMVNSITPSNDRAEFEKVVFSLLEVYSFLERCNQVLLENEMKGLFNKYVEST